jgi:hypothetical protein
MARIVKKFLVIFFVPAPWDAPSSVASCLGKKNRYGNLDNNDAKIAKKDIYYLTSKYL